MTESMPTVVGGRDEVVDARAALTAAPQPPTPAVLGAVHDGLLAVPADDVRPDVAVADADPFPLLAVRRRD